VEIKKLEKGMLLLCPLCSLRFFSFFFVSSPPDCLLLEIDGEVSGGDGDAPPFL